MGYQVDNAIIMAAGLSSRFAPLSYEKPKPLINVQGEILVERQIRQLREKGISDIILVTGYKKEQFYYLKEKFNITIVENKEYFIRNNHASIYAAREYLSNTYICSADNYFLINPFEAEVEESYYAALFAPDETAEWCLTTDEDDYITDIEIGGRHQWYMMGQTFWSESFSHSFIQILEEIYDEEETKGKLWESIYQEHLQQLKMKIRRYQENQIFEFDSLDELRLFDNRYNIHSGSTIMEDIAGFFHCPERCITNLEPVKSPSEMVIGVKFCFENHNYQYLYDKREIKQL